MPSHSPAPSPDIVDSWKEIAAYLNHDVRTVMRWEQTRGMPVHRLPGESKSAVHALKSELDAWRKSRRIHALEVGGGPERGLPSPAPGAPSIAVLPFLNLSADKENEYFSDGLAEEILNLLAKIPGLKVIARTSSFAFRGKEQDITKIAEALRADNPRRQRAPRWQPTPHHSAVNQCRRWFPSLVGALRSRPDRHLRHSG